MRGSSILIAVAGAIMLVVGTISPAHAWHDRWGRWHPNHGYYHSNYYHPGYHHYGPGYYHHGYYRRPGVSIGIRLP